MCFSFSPLHYYYIKLDSSFDQSLVFFSFYPLKLALNIYIALVFSYTHSYPLSILNHSIYISTLYVLCVRIRIFVCLCFYVLQFKKMLVISSTNPKVCICVWVCVCLCFHESLLKSVLSFHRHDVEKI